MDQIKQEKNRKLISFALMFFVIAEMIFVLVRACYGTEVTDEAFYLSTANQILQGRVPFADIWIGSGSSLCYAWVIALYKVFVPNLDGIFLFSRVVFHVIRIIIIIYGFWVLTKKEEVSKAILAVGVLVPYYTLIGNFSYNSVPIYLMILAGFLTIDATICTDRCQMRSFIIGIVVALAIYSHPNELLNALVLGAVILCFSEHRMKNCLTYVGGGVLTAGVIGGWSAITCGGLDKFVYGIKVMLNVANGINKAPAYIYIEAALLHVKFELFSLLFLAGVTFIGTLVYIWRIKQEKNILLCRYITTISILVWFVLATLLNASDAGYPFYTKFGAVIMLAVIAGFIVAPKDRMNCIFFACLALPNIVFCITNGLMAGSGIITRMYTMIPCIMAYTLITGRMLQLMNVKAKISVCVELAIFLMVSLLLIRFDYRYVYRDNAIASLTTKVSSGLYKGLYTTEAKAESLCILQQIVEKNVSEEEKVIVMDCTPSVYMMTDATTFAPNTWDVLYYNDGRNNPEPMLHYFDFMEDIPDKILYVANPYKPKLSIDDPDFLFNDFVHENYHLIKQENINDIYDVRIYEINQDNHF